MLIESVLVEHELRSPVFVRRELRATFRRERRANAPSYTRRVWLQEIERALGCKLGKMLDRRQLELFA